MKLVRISAIWCSSCIITKSLWDKLKLEYPDYSFEELDYDMDDIEKYNVGEILPVVISFKDGKEINRVVGEVSYEKLKGVIINEKTDI